MNRKSKVLELLNQGKNEIIRILPPQCGKTRIRKIISRAACRPTFKYYSKKLRREVHTESHLESDLVDLLEACGGIAAYGEQSHAIYYRQDNKISRHIPDFRIETKDKVAFVEVKYLKDIDERVLDRTKFMKSHLKSLGIDYYLVSENNIHKNDYLGNAKFLLKKRLSQELTMASKNEFCKFIGNSEFTLIWADFIKNGFETDLAEFILNGVLEIDFSIKITEQTNIHGIFLEKKVWVWDVFA